MTITARPAPGDGRVRLQDMRQAAADRVENLVREAKELREELERVEARKAAAEAELVYWSNVREPAEILRECGFEGTFETVISGTDFVRDGVKLRRCNRTHPCPDHGRPLGGSDWRLHPVNTEAARGYDIIQGGPMPVAGGCSFHRGNPISTCPSCQAIAADDVMAGTPVDGPVPDDAWPIVGCIAHRAFAMKDCRTCQRIRSTTVDRTADRTRPPLTEASFAGCEAHRGRPLVGCPDCRTSLGHEVPEGTVGVTCPIHNTTVGPLELCPGCKADGERMAAENPLKDPP